MGGAFGRRGTDHPESTGGSMGALGQQPLDIRGIDPEAAIGVHPSVEAAPEQQLADLVITEAEP